MEVLSSRGMQELATSFPSVMSMGITYPLSAMVALDIVGVWIGMEMRLMAPEAAREFDHHVSG